MVVSRQRTELRRLQAEDRHFGPYVEPDAPKVPNPAADVQTTLPTEGEFASRVAAILHRQQWRGQKGWLALAAMGMAAQHPAVVVLPTGPVHCIGVMAEDQHWLTGPQPRQYGFRSKAAGPEIIQAYQLETGELVALVSEDGDPSAGEGGAEAIRNLGMGPVGSIIMIAEDAHGPEAPMWGLVVNRCELIEDLRVMADEISGVDDEIGIQAADPIESVQDVGVVDATADVNIA